MTLKKWAFVFLSPGFESKELSVSLSSDYCEVHIVGIGMSEKERVVGIAKALVTEGAQMIELCGGFGPIWIARVSEAIHGAVPVGSVAYGPEARSQLLSIIGSTALPKEKEEK